MSPVRPEGSIEAALQGLGRSASGQGWQTGVMSGLTSLLGFPGPKFSSTVVELDPMASFRSKGWQVKIAKQSGVEVRPAVSGYWLVAPG